MRPRAGMFFILGAVVAFLAVFNGAALSFASTTDGTIDATNKYAWGDRMGWVNFGTSGGNVHVTDSALTGHAWSENYGWINLNPTQSGVKNNNEGDLSGYAWGEKLGWVDFSSVSISAAGVFSGTAVVSSTSLGSVSFDCTNCSVVTDWRPASTRNTTPVVPIGVPAAGGGGGGGGGAPLGTSTPGVATGTPPVPPTQPQATSSPGVRPPQVGAVGEVIPGGAPGGGNLPGPLRFLTVFDRVRDFLGNLLFPKPRPPALPPIASFVPRVPQQSFRGPWNLLPVRAIREFVFAPLPREFVLLRQRLPHFGATLQEVGVARMTDLPKFVNARLSLPGLSESAGIGSSGLALPGIPGSSGIHPVDLASGRFALPAGIPLTKMETQFKQRIPREIVFARSIGEKIDFPIGLVLNKKGILEQRIRTVVGSSLSLAVKPGAPTISVKGYLVLKTRLPEERTGLENSAPRGLLGAFAGKFLAQLSSVFEIQPQVSLPAREVVKDTSIPLQKLFASAFFVQPEFAEPAVSTPYVGTDGKKFIAQAVTSEDGKKTVEERYALLEFEYTDPDGDGIYTADVQVPRVDGEYEIITLISYKDPELGTREIRLTTIIDPEGYVYEKQGDKEIRIPGAIVSLFALNPSADKYELWPAREYHQENPQVTDVRGTYAYLVPQGVYYVGVTAPGYPEYQGKPFEVSENNEVHFNIELRSTYGWMRIIDWKTLLLILVSLLLVYNFYRDRTRVAKK